MKRSITGDIELMIEYHPEHISFRKSAIAGYEIIIKDLLAREGYAYDGQDGDILTYSLKHD